MRIAFLPILVLAVVVTATAATSVAVAANDPREAEARTLFFKGDYQRALDIFATLYADNGDPVLLRNMGRCHQKLLQPDKAIEAFRAYLRRSPKLKLAEREEIAGFIREMEALKTKQEAERAAAADASSAESRAGPRQPAVAETDPPPSSRASAPELNPQPPASPPLSGADLTERRTTEAEVRSERGAAGESESIGRKWWFWTGVGALVVGGVATAVIISRSGGSSEPPCPDMWMCPRN